MSVTAITIPWFTLTTCSRIQAVKASEVIKSRASEQTSFSRSRVSSTIAVRCSLSQPRAAVMKARKSSKREESSRSSVLLVFTQSKDPFFSPALCLMLMGVSPAIASALCLVPPRWVTVSVNRLEALSRAMVSCSLATPS